MTGEVTRSYTVAAQKIAARFNQIDSARLFAPLAEWLPNTPSRVLDVGAGTGRDARWLTALGHTVVAADPVPELRAASGSDGFKWVTAALPDLTGLASQFDLITLSAVWHHVAPNDRARAMTRLAELTKPHGRCFMSLREGPSQGAPSWPAPVPETCSLASRVGFDISGIVGTVPQQAHNKDAGVRFTWLVLTRQVGAPNAKNVAS